MSTAIIKRLERDNAALKARIKVLDEKIDLLNNMWRANAFLRADMTVRLEAIREALDWELT